MDAAPRPERRARAGLMKYPSVPPPMLSPPRLQRHTPALVSGVLHYLATLEGLGLRKNPAPTLQRREQMPADCTLHLLPYNDSVPTPT